MNVHFEAQKLAAEFFKIEKIRLRLANQMSAFEREHVSLARIELICDTFDTSLAKVLDGIRKEISALYAGQSLGMFVDGTVGLGAALLLVVGRLPRPVGAFKTVSGVWKYCGLHVVDGSSRRAQRGVLLGFNPSLRAFLAHRIAEPCMKNRESPYRAVYDARKAHTLETHPPMLKAGEGCEFCDIALGQTKARRAAKNQTRERTVAGINCSEVGGVHWTDGHRHADALRVTGKAILRDAWRVDRGMEPKF